MKPILYPIIFRLDDMLVPGGGDFPGIWSIRHLEGSQYETLESIHPSAGFHWLIDGEAEWREFNITGKRREWARPFRHVWRGVRVRYELGEGKPVTIGTLRRMLEGKRMDREKSLTPALIRFLRGRDDSVIFSKGMFSSFMNGPARINPETALSDAAS